MQYFCIYPDDLRHPDQWFLDEPRSAEGLEIDARQFIHGVPYCGPRPATVPIGNPGHELDFSFGAFHMNTVSLEVADIIRNFAAQDVEFFPVRIPGAKKEYTILNTITQIDCLDESRSEFTRWPEDDDRPYRVGTYRMIYKLLIDPERARGHHLLRIKGWSQDLLVSKTLKEALEMCPNLGIEFRPAS